MNHIHIIHMDYIQLRPAVSAAGAEQISVRTSEASRALWGGNDRVLSRPEEWNRAMKEEAEAELAMLGN